MSQPITHCVFDAYGTLFDVHAAVRRHAEAVGPDHQALSELWRAKQLEYSWVRTLIGAYRDFRALTEDALDHALARLPSVDRGLKAELLASYWTLDAYPEVPEVLAALRGQGIGTAILSNGSPDMLEAAVQSAGLAPLFDAILSVDAIRVYKTAPDPYRMVEKRFGVAPGAVSFQSSNRWDIAGARHFGFRTVWINRAGLPDEYPDLPPHQLLSSLSPLPGLIAAG